MWLFYNGIDIDYYEEYLTEVQVVNFARKIAPLAKKLDVDIYNMFFEDDDACYICLKKKGAIDEWDSETINFERVLTNNGFDVTFTNEDYGDEFDVLLILFDEEDEAFK